MNEVENLFLRVFIKKTLVEKGGVRIVAPNECRRMICKLAKEMNMDGGKIKPIIQSILIEMLDEMFAFELK